MKDCVVGVSQSIIANGESEIIECNFLADIIMIATGLSNVLQKFLISFEFLKLKIVTYSLILPSSSNLLD